MGFGDGDGAVGGQQAPEDVHISRLTRGDTSSGGGEALDDTVVDLHYSSGDDSDNNNRTIVPADRSAQHSVQSSQRDVRAIRPNSVVADDKTDGDTDDVPRQRRQSRTSNLTMDDRLEHAGTMLKECASIVRLRLFGSDCAELERSNCDRNELMETVRLLTRQVAKLSAAPIPPMPPTNMSMPNVAHATSMATQALLSPEPIFRVSM